MGKLINRFNENIVQVSMHVLKSFLENRNYPICGYVKNIYERV